MNLKLLLLFLIINISKNKLLHDICKEVAEHEYEDYLRSLRISPRKIISNLEKIYSLYNKSNEKDLEKEVKVISIKRDLNIFKNDLKMLIDFSKKKDADNFIPKFYNCIVKKIDIKLKNSLLAGEIKEDIMYEKIGQLEVAILNEVINDELNSESFLDAYKSFLQDKKLKIMVSMVKNLLYLHHKNIIHCDVQLKNFVYTNNFKNIKIYNFKHSIRTGKCFNPKNRNKAPESIRNYKFESTNYDNKELNFNEISESLLKNLNFNKLLFFNHFLQTIEEEQRKKDKVILFSKTPFWKKNFIEDFYNNNEYDKLFNLKIKKEDYKLDFKNFFSILDSSEIKLPLFKGDDKIKKDFFDNPRKERRILIKNEDKWLSKKQKEPFGFDLEETNNKLQNSKENNMIKIRYLKKLYLDIYNNEKNLESLTKKNIYEIDESINESCKNKVNSKCFSKKDLELQDSYSLAISILRLEDTYNFLKLFPSMISLDPRNLKTIIKLIFQFKIITGDQEIWAMAYYIYLANIILKATNFNVQDRLDLSSMLKQLFILKEFVVKMKKVKWTVHDEISIDQTFKDISITKELFEEKYQTFISDENFPFNINVYKELKNSKLQFINNTFDKN